MCLCDLGLMFLKHDTKVLTQVNWTIQQKVQRFNGIINKVKNPLIQEIYAIYISYKESVFRIYKELTVKRQPNLEMGK